MLAEFDDDLRLGVGHCGPLADYWNGLAGALADSSCQRVRETARRVASPEVSTRGQTLIRSCRSLFAIQLKHLPQVRDEAASRLDVLDRQVLGKGVRPRRLQTAGLVVGPAPLVGQHDE